MVEVINITGSFFSFLTETAFHFKVQNGCFACVVIHKTSPLLARLFCFLFYLRMYIFFAFKSDTKIFPSGVVAIPVGLSSLVTVFPVYEPSTVNCTILLFSPSHTRMLL